MPDVSDVMRRYVKENLLTFEGKRLFTERKATTVNYDLSPGEQHLCDEVTNYVRTGMNRAQALEDGGAIAVAASSSGRSCWAPAATGFLASSDP